MKLGVFGGSFDPVHNAHLIAAELVAEEFGLDELLFVPARIPPHKRTQKLAPDRDRLEMLRLATASNPRFGVSSIELEREGPSYTIDTVKRLLAEYRIPSLHLVIGLDNLAIFHSWNGADELKHLTNIVAVARPTTAISELDESLTDGVQIMPIPLLKISASAIRARVREGKSIRYQVPDPVREYIEAQKLYRD